MLSFGLLNKDFSPY